MKNWGGPSFIVAIKDLTMARLFNHYGFLAIFLTFSLVNSLEEKSISKGKIIENEDYLLIFRFVCLSGPDFEFLEKLINKRFNVNFGKHPDPRFEHLPLVTITLSPLSLLTSVASFIGIITQPSFLAFGFVILQILNGIQM